MADSFGSIDGRALRSLLGPVGHGSTTDAVTDALREGVLSGLLAAHSWLREDELSRMLEVSRTPVRDALRRLSDEGLTIRVANRGSMVAPMPKEEIVGLYAVREPLEALAAASVARRSEPEVREALLTLHQRAAELVGDPDAFEPCGLQFHRTLRDACGISYLQRFLIQTERGMRRFNRQVLEGPGRVAEIQEEHERILIAIADGDDEGAGHAMATHIRNVRDGHLSQLLGD